MQLSFRMIVMSLMLFLSDMCANLNAAGNQNLLYEDDSIDGEEEVQFRDENPLVPIGPQWIVSPENIRDKVSFSSAF